MAKMDCMKISDCSSCPFAFPDLPDNGALKPISVKCHHLKIIVIEDIQNMDGFVIPDNCPLPEWKEQSERKEE